jgi:hypothetical protein
MKLFNYANFLARTFGENKHEEKKQLFVCLLKIKDNPYAELQRKELVLLGLRF